MADQMTLAAVHNALDNILPKHQKKTVFPPIASALQCKHQESELSEVLLKVQEDIKNIKSNVLGCLSNQEPIDYDNIKRLFENAEKEIQKRKDIVSIKDLKTRPAFISTEKIFNKDETKNELRVTNISEEERPLLPSIQTTLSPSKKNSKHNHTSGQKLLAVQKLKSIINPTRRDTRAVLHKHYGVPLPIKDGREQNGISKLNQQHHLTGTTLHHPSMNKLCNSEMTSCRSKDDNHSTKLDHKLPQSFSQLTLAESPIQQKPVVLHQLSVKQQQMKTTASRPQYNLAVVKFDEDSLTSSNDTIQQSKTYNSLVCAEENVSEGYIDINDNVSLYQMSSSHISLPHQYRSMKNNNKELQHYNQTLVSVPTTAFDNARVTHKFVIQNGKVQSNSQDFVHFKNYYCLSWGSIIMLLQKLEKLTTDYSIPIAFVDGDRLADLSLFFELGPKPTIKDLLMCVINNEDVERIILIPGRRYMAPDGLDCASIKIQAYWRCHQKHSAYLEYRRKKWAAGIIALSWIMKCKMTMIRKQMKLNQIEYLKRFRKRSQTFSEQWNKMKSSKRLIIHIPSIGYSTNVRDSVQNVAILENQQIGRICEIIDPNVEVLYICPIQLTEELSEYYMKLVQVMANVSNQDYDVMKEKIKIITPEMHDRFPAHNLCTSALLKYSTKTLKRIKRLIKGKQAYIVPGVMHADDLYLSNKLDVPVLGTEPNLVQLYSMKSGIRRIFHNASVKCPPGEHDIYSAPQLFEVLARLVTENLDVQRWLFKIDNEFDGRGTAYCDISPYLTCYQYAVKEQQRYAEEWKQKWAHEPIYNLILKEISVILDEHAQPVDTNVFPTWFDFLHAFLRQGGIVEACPPSDSITGLTSHVLVEPDGNIDILSIADQIHSTSPYKCFGHTLPQSSIDAAVITSSINSISHACKQRGIIGYITIDFVTFIHPETDCQELWAVGLHLGYSSSYATFQLLTALTNGKLDTANNTYHVTSNNNIRNNVFYRSKRRKSGPSYELLVESQQRYCVYSPHLLHTNFNNVHYGVFFQMCKARGIGYDDKLKLGTLFALFDHTRRQSMGMITVGESLDDAISMFVLNLSLIHTDISAPGMQGKNNFRGAIEDLENILEGLKANEIIEQENYPTASPALLQYKVSSKDVLNNDNMTPSPHQRRAKSCVESTRDVIANEQSMAIASPLDHNLVFNDNRFPSSPVSNFQESDQESRDTL